MGPQVICLGRISQAHIHIRCGMCRALWPQGDCTRQRHIDEPFFVPLRGKLQLQDRWARLEIPSCDRWVYEIKHGRVRNCNFNSMCGSVLRHCFFDGLGSEICVVIFSMASRCLWVFRTSSQGCPPKVVFPHQSVRAIYWAVVRQQDPHGGALVLGSVVDGERRPDGGWSRWGMVAPSTSEWDVAGYCKVDQLTVAAQVSQRGDDERLDSTNQQTEPTQQTMLGIKQCTHVT